MMYHLKFSLTGGSSVSVGAVSATSPPAVCSTVSSPCSGISSSAMVSFSSEAKSSIPLPALVLGQFVQQCANCVANNVVDSPEVRRKQKHSYDDHRRGGAHLGRRRRPYLAQLVPCVLEKLDQALWSRLQFLDPGIRFTCHC